MDYGKLVARSFEITRKYRALWLFGVLLALFGGGGGFNPANFSNFGGSSGRGSSGGAGGNLPPVPAWVYQSIGVIIIALLCFALVWIVLSIVLRFLSRGALIGSVQELEANGTTPMVGRGFGIGGSRFWQLLGIGLTINIPLFILSLALFLIAGLPALATVLPMIAAGRPSGQIAGAFAAGLVGSFLLLCCVGVFLWIVGLIVKPFYEFFVRECVIQKRGVFDSIREGYRIVRSNVGNVAVLYILIIGVGIGYGILMLVVGLILIGIPVVLAFVVGVATHAATPAIIVGLVIGIPMLLILLFINGLYRAFESTLWTEGYLAVIAPKTPGVAL